jgi:hypothetical protein
VGECFQSGSDTEGIQSPAITGNQSVTEPNEKAAAIVQNARLCPIHHAGFVSLEDDIIRIPPPSTFHSLCPRLKIRWKSDGDSRGWCVTWSDVENQGLVLFLCALDEKEPPPLIRGSSVRSIELS